MRRAHKSILNQVGGSRLVSTSTKVGDSNDDGTEVQLSDEKIFGIDFDNEEGELQKQRNYKDFIMFIKEDESSGSQHSTSKPKPKKKKKPVLSRKEFVELKGAIDQILAAVSTSKPP